MVELFGELLAVNCPPLTLANSHGGSTYTKYEKSLATAYKSDANSFVMRLK